MKISALTSSVPNPLPEAIVVLAELGFRWIDVPPAAASGVARQVLERTGLGVTCVGLERGMPDGLDLASPDRTVRSASVDYFRRTIEMTAALRAPVGYLTPPTAIDRETRQRWMESLVLVADHARRSSVRVCVEHFPRRLLPTVTATLEFLDHVGHESLALLLDVGHCLISNEDPAAAVIRAGPRLGYVHWDDNDGEDDLHWALLTGKLTDLQIHQTMRSLHNCGYSGGLCLELRPTLEDPRGNLLNGRAVLERHL